MPEYSHLVTQSWQVTLQQFVDISLSSFFPEIQQIWSFSSMANRYCSFRVYYEDMIVCLMAYPILGSSGSSFMCSPLGIEVYL
jgi:hypothetical protein